MQLLPLYHPTTIVLIDDSLDFLRSMAFQLDPSLSVKIFDSAHEALHYIQAQRDRQHPMHIRPLEDAIQVRHDDDQLNGSNRIFSVGLESLHRTIYDPRRFSEISVVVVDFAMPEMNGLEFCKRLEGTPIKRILLTGQADERTGIEAFNAGLIDRFLLKQSPNTLDELPQTLATQQGAYLKNRALLLDRVLSLAAVRFLADPAFQKVIQYLYQRHHFIEHYLITNPDGLLLARANGSTARLIIETQEGMRAHIEVARDNDAPEELIELLRTGSHVPFFWSSQGMYSTTVTHWQSHLLPAQRCQGNESYFWTLVEQPPGLFSDMIYSYDAHLAKIAPPDVT